MTVAAIPSASVVGGCLWTVVCGGMVVVKRVSA